MATSEPGWVALRIEVAAGLADAVANFLFEAGVPGVLGDEPDARAPAARLRLEASLRAGEETRVAAALERYLASLAEIEPAARQVSIETAALPAVDWNAVAREHHRPVAIGRRLLIAPPWDVPEAPGREVLVVEPGMAFGTGQHATTRGCLEAIEAAVLGGDVRSALDVGTGSGILALALARLGVDRVTALDVDPDTLPIARANLARNAAPHVTLLGGTVAAVRQRFDLVVANLLADVLVAQAADLAATVDPGGRLIVSGLLDTQAPTVRAAYRSWRVVARHAADGWCTLTLVHER